MGPVPVPVLAPADALLLAPGEADEPEVGALVEQLRAEPSLSHLVGYGAVLSTVSTPLVNVGFWQLDRQIRLRPGAGNLGGLR